MTDKTLRKVIEEHPEVTDTVQTRAQSETAQKRFLETLLDRWGGYEIASLAALAPTEIVIAFQVRWANWRYAAQEIVVNACELEDRKRVVTLEEPKSIPALLKRVNQHPELAPLWRAIINDRKLTPSETVGSSGEWRRWVIVNDDGTIDADATALHMMDLHRNPSAQPKLSDGQKTLPLHEALGLVEPYSLSAPR